MAIHRSTSHHSSDSWSRCDPDQYSNLYDVRRRADVKLEPIAATRPVHKDTLEISHDKLKEEALNRLRHTSKYVIAQNGFMRIGKYLFLAVALPPYFAIYGLPRWVFIEGLPSLFSFSLWMWKKLQNQTEKQIHIGMKKVIQMAQFVQKVVQVMLQPLVHLALQIRQRIRRFRDHSFHLIKKARAKINLSFPFPSLKLALNERANDIRHFLSRTQEKWEKKKEKMALQMQQGGQWIKDSPHLISEWAQCQFQRFIRQVISSRCQWKNCFQASDQWAQKGTNWISGYVHTCFKILGQPFVLTYHAYKTHMQPFFQKIKEFGKKNERKLEDFFRRYHRQVYAFLESQQVKLKHLSSERFLSSVAFHPWLKKLHVIVQKWLKKCLFHSLTRKICRGGLKCYVSCVNVFLITAKMSLDALSKTQTLSMKCYQWVCFFIQSGSKSALAVLVIGVSWFQKGALHVLYYFLLFLTISFILLVWALESLGSYSNDLVSAFSLALRKRSR